MIQITQVELEEFLFNPVEMAREVMGADLDTFQQARLRIYWFFPYVIDSSGVSTAKTEVQFIYTNLRCICISDHVAGIYFPNFQTAKDEFWPKFETYMERSERFRAQFVFHHNKLGEHKYPGAWVMDYKNKSKFIMPAPSFMTDSMTQASRRFNTLAVDDWLRAEDMGEGISKQLVDRCTRASFNKNHPVWCNHQKFLGHAESPEHKGHVRYKAYRRAIMDGSQRHALITFNFHDWSPRFAQKYREDNVIAEARRTLTRDQFQRQYLGIWTRDGQSYYPETLLEMACRAYVVPAFGRLYENEINILGSDVAPGDTQRADWCANVVYRMVEVNDALKQECEAKDIPVPPITLEQECGNFNCTFPYGDMMKNMDAAEIAAHLHYLHQIFAFSQLILDKQGGGIWVYKFLLKKEQIIGGGPTTVVPLCTRDEIVTADKQPIVVFAKRGSELDQTILPGFLTGDDGFLEAIHRRYRESWIGQEHHWPQKLEDRDPAAVRGWGQEHILAQRVLDLGLKQLANVRQAEKDGKIMTTARGFRMFLASGKKDVAYAGLYAHAGGQLYLKKREEEGETEESVAMAAY